MKLNNIQPERVFYYFEQICDIPHGSGNMGGVSRYCRNFAINHGFDYYLDDAKNVIIYKPASEGYEGAEPVILQGHLDMVCQKAEGVEIDFFEDGIEPYIDGDFVKARGTTLGADNGIAVAMMLAILEDDTIKHPPIEAVFTTEEEVGMIGARQLDMTRLKGRRMVNIDAEEADIVTVSCAGGSDFTTEISLDRCEKQGTMVQLSLKGLRGGHSGIEINGNRINADILAGRILNHLARDNAFDVISIDGGDKGNAIPNNCKIVLCVDNADEFVKAATDYVEIIKNEISDKEPDFEAQLEVKGAGTYSVFSAKAKSQAITILACVPDGVMAMSAGVSGLVETSLNLGILKTEDEVLKLHITLRSNKWTALLALEERLTAFFDSQSLESNVFAKYPPWEYKADSALRSLYVDVYKDTMGEEPGIAAIHAGLECGVFAAAIKDFDCIAIGPYLYDVHTTKERVCISDTENVYKMLLKLLENLR
ncbi:MAG: beta-Ala-His dipeptidase [Clostridia bacterium]|nr:beta-Ala-His dipeptidase [Clostridia bacterium]